MTWAKLVWSRTALPKTRFILWLVFLDKLKTKDRLLKISVTPDDLCPLCGENSESINHLFFACRFSKKCLDATMAWLGSNVNISSLSNLASKKWRVLVARRKIICIALSCLVYNIWQCRNEAIWLAKVKSIETMLKNIKLEVKTRSSFICAKEVDRDAI